MQYIERVIIPYCTGHPATVVVDSYTPHLTDSPVDTAMKQEIFILKVPARETSALKAERGQGIWPLSRAVHKAWVEQLHWAPEVNVNDNIQLAIERYLEASDALRRETVIQAWKEAVTLLRNLKSRVRSVDE